MQPDLVEKLVADWAKKHSESLELTKSEISATYIYNPGGFVNQSFRLSDGNACLHVKFADERKATHLKQWAKTSEYLMKNYHGPQLVQEVAEEVLPGHGYGLVFEYIDAQPLDVILNPMPVVYAMLEELQQLHSDTKLQQIVGSDEYCIYADAFIEEYIARFEEDLQIIRSGRHLLDFVSDESLDWFYSEVKTLKQIANRQPIFQKLAKDVVHNDLNWQNILVNGSGDFWIIDWDDMTVSGDAAMDYSVLLWPLYRSMDFLVLKNIITQKIDKEIMERMMLYFRAKLLDDVIDVLADYVEAESFPAVKESAQKQARKTHLCAYKDYRKKYSSSKFM